MKQTPPKQDNNLHTKPLNVQLTPDYLYTICNGSTVLAQIVATATDEVRVIGSDIQPSEKNTEFWYVNAGALAALANDSNVTLSIQTAVLGDEVTLDPSATYAFNSAEAASWTSELAAPSTRTNRIFSGIPAAPEDATAAYLLLNLTLGSPGGQYSLTGVQWYLTGLTSCPDDENGVLQPGSSAGIQYPAANLLPTVYWAAASH
jgi:hypothetical protein